MPAALGFFGGLKARFFSEISIDADWRFPAAWWIRIMVCRGRFGGSELRVRQWGRWIFGQIQREIIYEVWGAVLVALHGPPETALFFYFQAGTLFEDASPLCFERGCRNNGENQLGLV